MQRADHPASLFISIGEAARLVGVSPATLRAWERRGTLHHDPQPCRVSSLYAYGHRAPAADATVVARACQLRMSEMRNRWPAHRRGDPVLSAIGVVQPASAPWGAHLRDQRLQRRLSLRQVAALTGLSASFISGIERGLANPSVAALQKLTAAYGVSIVDLVEGALAPRGRLVRISRPPTLRLSGWRDHGSAQLRQPSHGATPVYSRPREQEQVGRSTMKGRSSS